MKFLNIDITKEISFSVKLILIVGLVLAIQLSGIAQEVPGNKFEDSPQTIQVVTEDGNIITLLADADEDGDGISNQLEQDGYYWNSDSLKIMAWNGDTTQAYFITDPLQASTDQDPYSDYTEVSGVNLDVGVFPPEDHPLVAARPRITVEMVEYEVFPLATISDAQGGSQGTEYTNEVSNSTTEGIEVTEGAEMGTGGINTSVSVTGSYSETVTHTSSTTSSSELNWNHARSTQPDRAARLELILYMENTGSTEALDIIPTVNLKLGDKIISTFNLPMAQSLTPRGTAGSRTPNINVAQANGQDITVSIDELRAIQLGTPLTLEVVQVQASVETLDSNNNPITKSWNQYMGDIDLVSVDVIMTVGEDTRRHQVFAGWSRWDPQYSFREILSLISDVEGSGDQTTINGVQYPADWYTSSPSQQVIDEWTNAGQPNNLLPLRMHRGTQIVMMSPGNDADPIVNLASYSRLPQDTSSYSRILVSAEPNKFPISLVTAEVSLNGAIRVDTLTENQQGFYTNSDPITGIPDGPGRVFVRNARGDVTEAPVILPAIYASASDVKKYSSFLPNPGGNYWIYQEGQPDRPMLLYCLLFDENGDTLQSPREYLSLSSHQNQENFSEWLLDTYHLKIYFNRIRINPTTLMVDTRDTTFVEKEWISAPYGPGGSPFEPAFGKISMNYCHLDTAYANINLEGTPFHVDPALNYEQPQWGTVAEVSANPSYNIIHIQATQPEGWTTDSQGRVGFSGDSLRLVYGDDFTRVGTTNIISGNAVRINDLDPGSYIDMGSSTSLNLTSSFTIEAWIYPLDSGVDSVFGGTIVNKEGEYELARFADGSIRFALANQSPGWHWINTGYIASENKWTHVVWTYDSGQQWIYLAMNSEDGIFFKGYSANGIIGDVHSDLNDLRVGGRQRVPEQQFQGLIDEVRIWNNARIPSQIQSTISDTLTAEYYNSLDSSLIGYWRFDRLADYGIGSDGPDDVRDYSVNENHGDLVGVADLTGFATGIQNKVVGVVPDRVVLNQNYPNPFNPTTTISFKLPNAGEVKLFIYNMLGQKVRTLIRGHLPAGEVETVWDGRNDNGIKVASGVYLYRLVSERIVLTRKMIMLK